MWLSLAGLLLSTLLAQPSFGQTSPNAFVAPTPSELHAAELPSSDPTWWKHALLYEIYPRSFQDTNGDGVGDLNGITQRLSYLQDLGVDAIWIAPMYPSPQVDFGYDISDYDAVAPEYGTLADFDRLVAAAKQHHIRILLDMVLNHTSDKHRWFVESAASRTNAKADWYVWNDGIPASGPGVTAYQRRFQQNGPHGPIVPPNNWVSLFGGSAWEWVPARQQFFYHRYYKQQPDLNWRNPAVEKAMFDAMRFWLDRGAAGFRLDAIPALFEDKQLRNAPETGGLNKQGDPNTSSIYTVDLPEVHDVIQRMRAMTDSYAGDRVLLGETHLPTTAALGRWYGSERHRELHMPMDMLLGFPPHSKLDAPYFRRYLTEAETELNGAQPLFVFDNHDEIRSWDRFGDGVHNGEIARLLATLLLTARSSALLYSGQELGMTTHTPTRVEDVRDPIGITGWPREKGRDGERTPMQWSAGPQAGFSSTAHTWLPVGADYPAINVESESRDPHSLLRWYEALIKARRENPTLRDGGIMMLDNTNPNVLSYLRTPPAGSKPILVSLNMSAQTQTLQLDLKGIPGTTFHTLFTSAEALQSATSLTSISLPPYASLVAQIQ